MYKLIGTFINNAKYDKTNAHPFSNYCVIHDMSKMIFNSEIEKDLAKWKQFSKDDINNAAKKLFLLNTESLNTKGKDVKSILN